MVERSPVVTFPPPSPGGDEPEWFHAEMGERRERIGFHDYARIYAVPGLYEELFFGRLSCGSPGTVAAVLARELGRAGVDPADLRVLDVGAGNGMVGAELADVGVRRIVGVDVEPEAARATARDRPGVYADYVVGDLTRLAASDRARVEAIRPNALTAVAALGFGHLPPDAFAAAFALLPAQAWLAFTIAHDFLDDADPTGFAGLIRSMLDDGTLEALAQERFRHRVSTSGQPLDAVAVVGRKRGEISERLTRGTGAAARPVRRGGPR